MILNFLIAAMMIASSTAATPSLTESDLAGAWRCGPTVMQGPGFTVTVTYETNKLSDGTYRDHSTTVIATPGETPITVRDRTTGTWELMGSGRFQA